MKKHRFEILAIITCLSAGLIGCDRSGSSPTRTSPSTPVRDSGNRLPVAAGILSAWQNGDQATAVRAFVAADWAARPLFDPASVLALTEQQYAALPAGKRATDEPKMLAEARALKELAAAVTQAGRDALAKGNKDEARKHFNSVKECGTALAAPDRISLLQVHGKAMRRIADTELAQIQG